MSTKKEKQTWVEPVIDGKEYRFEIRTGSPKGDAAIAEGTKLGRGANFRCILSGAPIEPSYIKAEGMAGRMGARLMAIVAEGKRRRIYLPPTAEMDQVAHSAKSTWRPEQDLPKNPRWFSPPDYGMPTYGDLFTERQLVTLTTLSDLVAEVRDRAAADAASASAEHRGTVAEARDYGDAVALYAAFAVDRYLNASTSICTWDSGPAQEKLRFTFARQAIPMTWDFAEGNPFSDASGNFGDGFEWICEALLRLPGSGSGVVLHADATDAQQIAKGIICTDPPYYDNIGYSDLSDLFYIWLRRSLQKVYPSLFGTVLVPKERELVADASRHQGKMRAEEFFRTGMGRALHGIAASHEARVPITVYYAFKQRETTDEGTSSTGWETFVGAVLGSGLGVSGTWPIRTELSNRLVGAGANALASSVVLACLRRPADAQTITRGDLRRLLRQELPEALRALQHGNIAPVDVSQASIGPGMAVFSRYKSVLEADGSPMTVRAALQLINEVLDEHLTEQEGELDADSRFAVTWYENRAFDAGPYGEAETLARARAVAVDAVAEAGIVKSGGGKVRLLKRGELPDDWDPTKDARLTTWEATQHLIKRLEEKGEDAAAELLTKLGTRAGAARDLAYRLYSTCERKGWTEEARAYNGLVVAWPDLERLANQGRETAASPTQQRLL